MDIHNYRADIYPNLWALMWEKQYPKPAMTGNGVYNTIMQIHMYIYIYHMIPSINMVMTGGWFMMVLRIKNHQ